MWKVVWGCLVNLIEQLGGYERAKIIQGSREMGGLPYDLDLEDALLQYRRQHNIFEPDDYIIHDGEFKVFAMWSSAVKGCADVFVRQRPARSSWVEAVSSVCRRTEAWARVNGKAMASLPPLSSAFCDS